jgi:hypothetical protein
MRKYDKFRRRKGLGKRDEFRRYSALGTEVSPRWHRLGWVGLGTHHTNYFGNGVSFWVAGLEIKIVQLLWTSG